MRDGNMVATVLVIGIAACTSASAGLRRLAHVIFAILG
ncbi:hypothetical protein VIH_000183 [Vibrio cholerae CT 5369-93]|nr:hypothetical protein VIH_000183 [Vibrio cholerae CT 5369-93]